MASPNRDDDLRPPSVTGPPVTTGVVGAAVARQGMELGMELPATDLQAEELGALLDALAGQPEVATWVEALRPEAGERSWQSVHRDDHIDVYVIAWTGGADTGWHDHDSSSGALRVLEGAVTQERLCWAPDRERQELGAGEGLSFGPDHVHRMTVESGRAVTLHAYSPPLRRMGQYTFDDVGALRRRTITYQESLRAVLAS